VLFRLHDPGSSFFDLLSSQHSQLIPKHPPEGAVQPQSSLSALPHGTTVLAFRYGDGVVIAGDRMATEGYSVSARKMDKVYKTDDFSAVAIAGAAGPCIELTRLFQTELEHYEKLEGVGLTTEGKANKLGQMIKSNLPMAFQGLVVVPIFVSYDHQVNRGRIFKYDITGGRYEETEFHATGSGGRDARNVLKSRYRPGLSKDEAIQVAVEALYNASEEDIGTGGPDPLRGIYPTVMIISAQGTTDAEGSKIKASYEALIETKKKGVSES
jgi:proteasome beta subunit